MKKNILEFILMSILSTTVFSQIELPSLICDNMVIQQDSVVSFWGNGSSNIVIEPSWTDEKYTDKCQDDGSWLIRIKTPRYKDTSQGSQSIVISDDDSTITINNILIGEVWLCSGQSNMKFTLQSSYMPDTEIALADYYKDKIRFFVVEADYSDDIKTDCGGNWVMCNSQTAKSFSAVGYYYGKELLANLDVPIGLIDSSWGGTPAQAWVKKSVLTEDEELNAVLERDKQNLANEEYYQKQYDSMLDKWRSSVRTARKNGSAMPRRPFPPMELRAQNFSSRLYNAMLHPLLKYKIKGVIWYQGESNVDWPFEYRKLFKRLIESWRQDWDNPDLPFYFVQLASFYEQLPDESLPVFPAKGTPCDDKWAELREAQFMALSLENTGMACIINIGEPYNIHPVNKFDVGRRLALWSLNKTYGNKDVVPSGPLYRDFRIEGRKIRIFFDFVAGSLLAKGETVEGFQIAGEDRNFVWADAVIDGDTVVVSSNKIDKPQAVRYGWARFPYCNLFNDKGLPASPFRTDNW